MPARLPPAVNIDDLGGPSPLPSSFDKPLHDKNLEDQLRENPLDLDPLPLDSTHPTHRHDSDNDRSRGSTDLSPTDDNQQGRDEDDFDDDALVEYSLSDAQSSLPADCPFTFLYLSSEDSSRDEPLDELNDNISLPNTSSTRQGTSHVPVTAEEVLRSTGDTRRKWIGTGKNELDNLTNTGTTTSLSPDEKEELKRKAKSTGQKYIELPAKAVFTIQPSKFKVRIVACGNKIEETFGKTSTTDLDTGMMRYIVSWAASLPNFAMASLDVTAAFLKGRIVVLRPPTVLYKLTLLPLVTFGLSTKPFTDFVKPPVCGLKSALTP